VTVHSRNDAILEASLDAVITMDHHGNVVGFNAAAERMFGYAREEAMGRSLGDLIIPPRLRASHARGLARYVTTGEEQVLGRRLEMDAKRADGREFPVELSIVRLESDGPPIFTGYIRDLTERRHAERSLRESEERFRTLVEMSSDAIFLADGEGRILHATSSLERVLGYAPAQLLGTSGFDPASTYRSSCA
jgi:PAS domain S-box-containing protein